MATFEHLCQQEDMKCFLEEINAQCWRYGYKTQASLGEALGVSQVTAGKYLRDPGDMVFRTLRRLVRTLKPDPAVVLKALGYTATDIKSFKEK